MVKPLPKKNLLEEMMHVSLFASSEPVVIEVIEISTPQEYNSEDPLHPCECERGAVSTHGLTLTSDNYGSECRPQREYY
jgi:hypothetical protein